MTKADIERFLRTGEYDPHFAGWPGDVLTRSRRAEGDLKAALIAEVRARAARAAAFGAIPPLDLTTFTRRKVEPMVRGLFARAEQDAVLGALERSVVFLTWANVAQVLRDADWLHTAWDLANLFLGSVGAEPLGAESAALVGISEETTCYISLEYFRDGHRFEDFIVHEAAHVFHNCKRHTLGLPATRGREWLLDIEFRKRETFAYACEAYSRIRELGSTPARRDALLAELANGPLPDDKRVDPDEYLGILKDAVQARNGWKRILARCAPARRPSARARRGLLSGGSAANAAGRGRRDRLVEL